MRQNVRDRFALHQHAPLHDTFRDDVRAGLTAARKSIPPQYFYDSLGSALFTAICELPEYYVTRAEVEILQARANDIVAAFGPPVRLAELGSGSARKTRLLIDAILARQPELDYVPLDIDPGALEGSARELTAAYPQLSIHAIAADFRDVASVLPRSTQRTILLFLGSSIGNLDRDNATALLHNVRRGLVLGDALFLGADLRKPKTILEPAYDDALGVTAAFNLNLLVRINRELGGHFHLPAFSHMAFFNEEESRIEMHLASRETQRVRIDALELEVAFEAGETIHTENSYKYDDATLEAIAVSAGFNIERQWTDSNRWFTDLLLRA
jgi:L-histidine N-alpha-methyltransferase